MYCCLSLAVRAYWNGEEITGPILIFHDEITVDPGTPETHPHTPLVLFRILVATCSVSEQEGQEFHGDLQMEISGVILI